MKLTKLELLFLVEVLDLHAEFVCDDEIKTGKLRKKVLKEIEEREFD